MKTFRFALTLFAGCTMLVTSVSCNNEQNVLGFVSPYDSRTTPVQLHLKVAGTRADTDWATDDEKAISIVNLYVFDENNKLDTVIDNKQVTDLSLLNIELHSAGKKTIYAVSAGKLFDPADEISLVDFKNTVFDTQKDNHLDKLKMDDSFVMVGCSEQQEVHTSGSANEIPATNIFNIRMERLVAKTQVDCTDIKTGDFGFTIGDLQFTVCHTNKKMRVVQNENEVVDEYKDENADGTYDTYSLGDASYINASKVGFTAENCKYLSENIVSDPKSGNTTFVIIKVPVAPKKIYTFAEGAQVPTGTDAVSTNPSTFYAVGIVDGTNGIADYAVDSDKKIIAFSNKDDADRYKSALNGGEVPGITVSDSETVLRIPSRSEDEITVHNFETVEFTDGFCYYRVNVGETVSNVFTPKVERNRFYKIKINSIKTLGYHCEEMLRPTDPSVDFDKVASTWIDSVFKVADWAETDQTENL